MAKTLPEDLKNRKVKPQNGFSEQPLLIWSISINYPIDLMAHQRDLAQASRRNSCHPLKSCFMINPSNDKQISSLSDEELDFFMRQDREMILRQIVIHERLHSFNTHSPCSNIVLS